MSNHTIGVVIPAAGASRRLGQPKQLIRFKDKPLLQLTIELASSIKPREIIVVTGAASDEIQANISAYENALSRVRMVHNQDWKDGIGSSISTGISAASRTHNGVLILLADQWRLQPADLQKLMQAWIQDSSHIVASRVGDYLGPPVIFPQSLFTDLAQLSGDQGARKVIQDNIGRLVEVIISNASADLDTPKDLAVLQSLQVQQ